MGNLFSFATIISSTMNGIIAFYIAYKLFSKEKRNYLTDQFKHFFVYFGLYFVVINLIVYTTLNNPYLFYVSVEAAHFILSLSLAFLFSAFLYIKHGKKTQTAFWGFIIVGMTITLAGLVTVNPEVNSLNATNAYLYKYEVLIPKMLFLTFGFMYPAISFFKEYLVEKDKKVARRYYLFSIIFTVWLIGGALHSQAHNPLIFLAGDLILLVGFIISWTLLINKKTSARKR
ncbi:hypothetical protein HGB13_03860 [bacterium]|nr:hypothetical protein [bacterium]